MNLRRLSTTLLLLLACSTAALARIPSPDDFLGHTLGADRRLADWERIVSYFSVLDCQSGRVRVDTLGPSTRGRP